MYQSTFFNSDYLIDPPHAELGHTIIATKRLAIFCVFCLQIEPAGSSDINFQTVNTLCFNKYIQCDALLFYVHENKWITKLD